MTPEPSVNVPASIFLYLAQLYKQQPMEELIEADYLKILRLEQRASSKLHKWTEGQK